MAIFYSQKGQNYEFILVFLYFCGYLIRLLNVYRYNQPFILQKENAMAEVKRRDFLGMALGGVTAVGAVASLIAVKKTWDPLPSVVSAGVTTVDVAELKEGDFSRVEWRGKPVFIIRKDAQDGFDAKRNFKIGDAVYTLGLQICTHLGCIPFYKSDEKSFLCPCHGGRFTLDGINVEGTPPPRPFDVPPFKVEGTVLTLGVSGPEYEAMLKA